MEHDVDPTIEDSDGHLPIDYIGIEQKYYDYYRTSEERLKEQDLHYEMKDLLIQYGSRPPVEIDLD